MDQDSADIVKWRKYIRAVMECRETLVSYGEHQGESKLREALAPYACGMRGVQCSAQNIVVGAGIQPLLYLLCGLIGEGLRTVAVEEPGFLQAEQVFADCGRRILRLPADAEGVLPEALEGSEADLLLISPSRSNRVSSMNRRLLLLQWAEKRGAMLVEDDYNGELRYTSRPVPAMQGMAPDRIVYLGSFSKLLLPSVRVSYMVLPQRLYGNYRQCAERYNQTASKVEQLALARYIREGCLERRLRRLRKLYAGKCGRLLTAVQRELGGIAEAEVRETALCLQLTVKNGLDGAALYQSALQSGVRVRPVSPINDPDVARILLGFAGIAPEEMEPAVRLLHSAWVYPEH